MSAGPLYTTENTVSFSGITRSLIDFYADQKGFATAQSGAQTIASGAGVLLGVIGLTGLLSGGGGAATTQSGCTITVIDAVSGATVNPQSGASNFGANIAGIFYQFNYGTQSGLGTGGLNLAPPDLTGINGVFKSGLVVVISGGVVGTVGVEVLFSRGA